MHIPPHYPISINFRRGDYSGGWLWLDNGSKLGYAKNIRTQNRKALPITKQICRLPFGEEQMVQVRWAAETSLCTNLRDAAVLKPRMLSVA